MGTKSAWTPERRARQAELIRQTKPWEFSTGPRSDAGKAVSARNAYAGDFHHDALARMARAKAAGLALFGRQRWPKGTI